MRLEVKNIAKIEEADIRIDGITVIAGENNTGKSTVGKVLYAVFNSLAYTDNKIADEKKQNINDIVRFSIRNAGIRRIILSHQISNQLDDIDYSDISIEEMRARLKDLFSSNKIDISSKDFDDMLVQIEEILCVSDDDYLALLLGKLMRAEFVDRINNIYSHREGKISLTIKEKTTDVLIQDDDVKQINNRTDLGTEIVYIDDPFVLDDLSSVFYDSRGHRQDLVNRLVGYNRSNNLKEVINNQKLELVYNKLSIVLNGDIVVGKNPSQLGYRRKDSNESISVKSLSTGLKTFTIMKMLLQNGSIGDNGTIILDEPEIHLHPDWQLVLAELVVLLQKEFNLNILLNTHSPYFLRAIEVYSNKYGIGDRCAYYLTEYIGETIKVRDVTDCTEHIYEKLYRPLQILDNEDWQNV